MMQKKMSKRKKKIIKVYGKDMLAEMYLDLLNITEGEAIPKRILSPLSGTVPKGFRRNNRKQNWNNDNTMNRNPNRTFKLNTTSIFNSPNNKNTSRSKSGSKSRVNKFNIHSSTRNQGGVTSADRTRHETADSKIMSQNSKRALSSGINTQNHSKTLKHKGARTRTILSPDPRGGQIKIHRKKIKSPVNLLKALGMHRKNNLLDDVLKMYK